MKRLQAYQDEESQSAEYLPILCQNGFMTCVCGYELIKQDETTYLCTGGGHTYNLENGDVVQDIYGNLSLKIPSKKGNKNAS